MCYIIIISVSKCMFKKLVFTSDCDQTDDEASLQLVHEELFVAVLINIYSFVNFCQFCVTIHFTGKGNLFFLPVLIMKELAILITKRQL